MPEKERSIRKLCRAGKVYVRCRDKTSAEDFLRQAQEEGFAFADGVKPTERHWSDLMAVSPDGTLCYVSAAGRIAVSCGSVKAVEWDGLQ